MSINRILIVGLIAATAVLAPTSAIAKTGDVRSQGTCSAGSSWKLKLSPENGQIAAELAVDQNRNGITWRVKWLHNGALIAKTTATTQPPSGSFTVRQLVPDTAGRDTVLAKAISPSGEVCKARATI